MVVLRHLLEGVPTRPSQNDPKRVAAWERRRRKVGTRISALRIERGLTQEQLSLLSGVSRNVLLDVEHGRRGILHERLFDIAKALGVSAADLVEGIR
ncbi:putative transcriptional regulator [Mycolicibacterium vulneris]|nr:putative transcriptional regulator [Mycolicibacterium vulneris]